MSPSPRVPAYAALLVAVASMGASVVFIRKSSLPPEDLCFYRLLLAGLVLLPLWFRFRKEDHEASLKKEGKSPSPWRVAVLPGLFLAGHFGTWVLGARMAPASNASLCVNMSPLVLPFLLWFLVRERVTGREIVATSLGVAGLFWIAWNDFDLSPLHFRGDLVCLGSMLLLATYYALGRRHSGSFSSPWVFTVPVFLLAALLFLLIILFQGRLPYWPAGGREWLWVAGLVLVPTILGHGLVLYSLGFLRGQVVGIFNIGQFLFATLFGWLVFAEVPSRAFWMGAMLATAGAVLAVTGRRRHRED